MANLMALHLHILYYLLPGRVGVENDVLRLSVVREFNGTEILVNRILNFP
jgi:hypothetical protein